MPETMRTPPTIRDLARAALGPHALRKEIIAALGNRVTWSAVKHWHKGRRKPPQWAVDLLLSKATDPAAIARQITLQADPDAHAAKVRHAVRAYWARRARERDAQKKRG